MAPKMETGEQPKETARRLIGVKSLKSLVSEAETAQGKISGMAGSLGQIIKDASESKNLHPAAFRTLLRLRKMDPVKLRGFLDNFDHYREVMRLDDMAASDLFDDPEPEGEVEADAEQEERLAKVGRGKGKGKDKEPGIEAPGSSTPQ